MFLGLAVATLIGAFSGLLIAWFHIQPVIVTLVLYIAGRGVAQLMSDGGTIVFYGTRFNDMGVARLPGNVPIQLVVEVVFVLAAAFILKKSTFGYYQLFRNCWRRRTQRCTLNCKCK